MKIKIVIYSIIFGLSISSGAQAQNVQLNIEEDREVRKSGNITFVETKSEYTRKKIDAIEEKIEMMRVQMNKARKDIESLQQLVAKLEEDIRSQMSR